MDWLKCINGGMYGDNAGEAMGQMMMICVLVWFIVIYNTVRMGRRKRDGGRGGLE
uniref:TMhelix containing protein n=1 Tax=Loa loa TaxID=7209 RepID=A0A1I7VYQ5_LOALO